MGAEDRDRSTDELPEAASAGDAFDRTELAATQAARAADQTRTYSNEDDDAFDRLAAALPRVSRAERGEATCIGRGAVVHRYVVHDRIGEGGMGVVYAAYDPELDRKIALKFLRFGVDEEQRQQRLLREAQAMARLSHPSVAAIYDVGTFRGQVFIAMEFIAGTTLGGWLEAQPRDWHAIRRVLVEAGRGLAAAHARGIVHRDFKPDNVLVDRDGHARVTDFGLARGLGELEAATEAAVEAGDPAASGGGQPILATPLTRTGAVLGTPCYMSPEQHRGEPADQKSDQYSFAVTLYQALYGQLPFDADSRLELVRAVLAGEPIEPPVAATVPAWLRKVVARGLATDSAQRYPSMDALLVELDARPRSRHRLALVVGLAVLLGAVGYSVVAGRRAPVCAGAEAKLEGIWDHGRKAAVHTTLIASGRPYAEQVWNEVEASVDAYAATWLADWRDVCAATHVRHEQSEHALDLRMRCLDRRLSELGATTALLASHPDPAIADQAIQAIGQLPSLAGCADVEALETAFPLPADLALRAEIKALDARLDAAWALRRVGKFRDGIAAVDAVLAAAEPIDYPPLKARTLSILARLQWDIAKLEAAEKTMRQALLAAAAARDDSLLAESLSDLLEILGQQKRFPEALAISLPARAAVVRVGGKPSLALGFGLAEALGNVANLQDDHAEAQRQFQTAVDLAISAYGHESEELAQALYGLSYALTQQDEEYRADMLERRALDILEQRLGPDHLMLAPALNRIGSRFIDRGELEEGLPYLEHAVRIWETSDDPELATSLYNLGLLHFELGRHAEAERACARSLAVREQTFGPDHPSLITPLTCLATARAAQHHLEAAVESLERVLALAEAHPGVTDQVIALRGTLAQVLWDLGRDRKRALALARQTRDEARAAGNALNLAEIEAWLAEHE